MRHLGQGFEVTVPLPNDVFSGNATGVIAEKFYEKYEELFGRRIDGVGIEAVTWRLHASAPRPEVALKFAGVKGAPENAVKGERSVYFPETGYAPCRVYNRYALKPGDKFRGPAVVEERESTTVIGPDASVHIDNILNLIIDIDEPKAQATEDKGTAHAHHG
jgi:N-methylhydantoinase A